ncbi:hypothetical protein GCM10022249_23600 [Enteractinococcus coprophilus]
MNTSETHRTVSAQHRWIGLRGLNIPDLRVSANQTSRPYISSVSPCDAHSEFFSVFAAPEELVMDSHLIPTTSCSFWPSHTVDRDQREILSRPNFQNKS